MKRIAILGLLALSVAACDNRSPVSSPSAPSTVSSPPAASPQPSTPTPSPSPSAPSISAVSPAMAIAGSDDLAITITGSQFRGFTPGSPDASFVVWNVETDVRTAFVSNSQLTAIIPANLLKTPGSAQLMVVNGDFMSWGDGYRGYPRSNAVSFEVVPR